MAEEDKYVPLTIENVCKELDGVDCMKENGLWFYLYVPHRKHNEITRRHSTQVNQTRATIEYWLSVDPTPSWRRLMRALEGSGEHKAVERVKPYVEPLTDPSLTAENVSSVLETMTDWEKVTLVLNVPDSREAIIKMECSNETQWRQAAADWWLRYLPTATWTWLAGRLYYFEERTALKAVSQYIHKETADPTLTPTNLWSFLCGVTDWWTYGLCYWLQVPFSVQEEIKQQTSDATQQKKTLLERWLRDHPAPSWAVVAEALYRAKELGILKQVKKISITGSQQLFEDAMQHGYVECCVTKVLVTGTAGSGKTCSKHVIIDENPPHVRKSTPCAERPIRVASVGVRGKKWVRIGPKRLINYLAAAIKLRSAREARNSRVTHEDAESSSQEPQLLQLQSEDSSSAQQLSSSKPVTEVHSADESVTSSTQKSRLESGASYVGEEDTSTSDKFETLLEAAVTEEELVRLIELTTSSDMLYEFAWIQFVDSGGQPQFLEVLPIFLRRTSVWVYVLKLSERLDEYPTIEFYDGTGSRICKPYAAAYTNKQIFQQFIQTMKSHKAAGSKCPKVLVIGTHRDKQSECTESVEEKNKALSKLLEPFADDIVYSNLAAGDVIFPLNAQLPDEFDRKIAEEIRVLIMRQCSPQPDRIPLGWYALQLKLREVAEALGREVISREECLAIARKLHMDETSLDAALEFLDSLNVIYYFKHILPKAIFCDTQVLLDKTTELVEFSYKLRDRSRCKFEAREGEWKNFSEYGLVSSSFLDSFEKHYVPGVFTSQELIKLFRALLILADFPKPGYYFMPCLLQRISQTEVTKHRAPATCFITHFPHGGRLGMFCALIAYLLSPENQFPCAWNVIVSEPTNTPLCLHRNCIKFALPHFPGKVTLIDSVDFFEIHVDAPSKVVAGLHQYVRSAVLVGLEKAADTLHYTNSKPQIAFPCPCDQGDFHVATVNLEQSWWLCSTNQQVYGELEEKHSAWLPVETTFTSEAASVEEETCELPTASKRRKLNENVDDQLMEIPVAKIAMCQVTNTNGKLREDELVDIMSYLHNLDKTQLTNLGLVLGLSLPRLKVLDSATFLGDMVLAWLQQADQVMTKSGVPTWRSLVKALRHTLLGQNGIARQIAEDKFLE